MERTAYVALGGNVGDRRAVLEQALEMLRAWPGVAVVRVSGFHQTAPVGGPAAQAAYLNAAAELRTSLDAPSLLAALHEVESRLGRNRSREVRWGPRTCDLDLLLMGDIVLDTPGLTLPHPRMHLRRFVLAPLAEIAPQAVHPVLGLTVRQMLDQLEQGA